MKNFIVGLFLCLVCVQSLAQIRVAAWTDKSSYRYGDTVNFVITAFNPTADTVILHFPTTCQVSFTIDNFNSMYHIACGQILTEKIIPPYATVQWNWCQYATFGSDWPPLGIGAHVVTGSVIGYGTSDTLLIFVTPGTAGIEEIPEPGSFMLQQNFPNPFNAITTIPFILTNGGNVVITLYNNLGQQLCVLLDEYRPAGSHTIRANLDDLPSGTYWCRLRTGGRSQTIKFLLAK